MSDQNWESDPHARQGDAMPIKPIDSPTDGGPAGRSELEETTDLASGQKAHPTALDFFRARWERNKAGAQFLADH